MAGYHILNNDTYVTYEQLSELVRSPYKWDNTVLEYTADLPWTSSEESQSKISVPFAGDVVTCIATDAPCQLTLTVWGATKSFDVPYAHKFVACPINLLRIDSSHQVMFTTSNHEPSMMKVGYKAYADIEHRRKLASSPSTVQCLSDFLRDQISF
jgi:hypothetical protein